MSQSKIEKNGVVVIGGGGGGGNGDVFFTTLHSTPHAPTSRSGSSSFTMIITCGEGGDVGGDAGEGV